MHHSDKIKDEKMAHKEKENQQYLFPLDLWTKETQIGRPHLFYLSRKLPTYQLKSITSQVHNDLDDIFVQKNVHKDFVIDAVSFQRSKAMKLIKRFILPQR